MDNRDGDGPEILFTEKIILEKLFTHVQESTDFLGRKRSHTCKRNRDLKRFKTLQKYTRNALRYIGLLPKVSQNCYKIAVRLKRIDTEIEQKKYKDKFTEFKNKYQSYFDDDKNIKQKIFNAFVNNDLNIQSYLIYVKKVEKKAREEEAEATRKEAEASEKKTREETETAAKQEREEEAEEREKAREESKVELAIKKNDFLKPEYIDELFIKLKIFLENQIYPFIKGLNDYQMRLINSYIGFGGFQPSLFSYSRINKIIEKLLISYDNDNQHFKHKIIYTKKTKNEEAHKQWYKSEHFSKLVEELNHYREFNQLLKMYPPVPESLLPIVLFRGVNYYGDFPNITANLEFPLGKITSTSLNFTTVKTTFFQQGSAIWLIHMNKQFPFSYISYKENNQKNKDNQEYEIALPIGTVLKFIGESTIEKIRVYNFEYVGITNLEHLSLGTIAQNMIDDPNSEANFYFTKEENPDISIYHNTYFGGKKNKKRKQKKENDCLF